MVPSFRCLNGRAAQPRRAIVMRGGSFALLFAFGITAGASTMRQQSQPKALGSLSVAGGVTINGSPAQPTQTIFAGDTVVTTNTGTATFTVGGQGSFKIAPLSQVSFSNVPRYVIELKQGTVVMDTFTQSPDLALRVGDYIVMADPTAAQTSIIIKAESSGSGVITCASGGAHIVAIQGDTSLSLQPGQSTSISSQEQTVAATATPAPNSSSGKKHKWLLFGLAGGGAAAAAGAAIAASGGGGHAVSPSHP